MKKTLKISAVNLKGGASKTTIVMNLAGVLHESGRFPLLIDMDPQQSATRWAEQGGIKFPFPVVSLNVGKQIKQFRTKLDQLIKEHKADIVLFDTPPQLEDEALLSALVSDIVLVPITPSPLDIWAGERAIETVREARQERKGKLPHIVIIPSRLMPKTILAKEIRGSLSQFNETISPSISMRVAVAESCIAGQTIHLYAPNSASHKEFKNLMKFLLNDFSK